MKPIILNVGSSSKLFAIQTDRFKCELLSMQFYRPTDSKTAQLNALLPAVLRRGTERFPSKQAISRHLDQLYSTTIAMRNRRLGDMQNIGFSADFLGARYVGGEELLSQVVSMMSELLFAPSTEGGLLRADFVESEKNNLQDAIKASINDPRAFAAAKCRALLCEGEPYALPLHGTVETAATITAEILTERYHAFLSESAPYFFYVGATDPTEVAKRLEFAFAGLSDVAPRYQTVVCSAKKAQYGELEMPLCQGKLSIGLRTDIAMGDRLAPALMLFNELYGGSPASKLFLNVREKRGLCYHCSSSLDLYKGVILANAGMIPENRAITEEAMLAELAALQSGNISAEELDAARSSLDHSYRQLADNPAALCDFYGGRLLAGYYETVEEWREKLSCVTLSDILEVGEHIKTGAVFFLNGTLEEDDE